MSKSIKFGTNVDCVNTVEPRYNEVLGTMKITLLYQVSHYIGVKKQRNIKSWDPQNYLVIRGFCYIRPLYNEVPLYKQIRIYAVKVHRSLAPLSRFRGSHIPTAHEQECCRFQSYANSVWSPMKFTSEIDIAWTTFLGSMTTDHVITSCDVGL